MQKEIVKNCECNMKYFIPVKVTINELHHTPLRERFKVHSRCEMKHNFAKPQMYCDFKKMM